MTRRDWTWRRTRDEKDSYISASYSLIWISRNLTPDIINVKQKIGWNYSSLVEQGVTLAFKRHLSYFIFTHVKITRQRNSTLNHTSQFFFKRTQTSAFYALAEMALEKSTRLR